MVRCPKCRCAELTIYEHFTVSTQIFMQDGVCVGSLGPQSGDSQGRFSGECVRCGHKWVARYETGQSAIAAAETFEAIQ